MVSLHHAPLLIKCRLKYLYRKLYSYIIFIFPISRSQLSSLIDLTCRA